MASRPKKSTGISITYEVLFRPHAERQLIDTARYYQGKADGLGVKFIGAVDKISDFIEHSPKIYPVCHDDFRRAHVTGFPYSLYFRIQEQTIWVYAILSQRMDLGKIRAALT